jgi:hypothetical protein
MTPWETGADGGHVALVVDRSLERGIVDEETMAGALSPYATTFGMTRRGDRSAHLLPHHRAERC